MTGGPLDDDELPTIADIIGRAALADFLYNGASEYAPPEPIDTLDDEGE